MKQGEEEEWCGQEGSEVDVEIPGLENGSSYDLEGKVLQG
jgi:hypothetical protein